ESLPSLTHRCRGVHVTGHIISALRRGKARVLISALRRGKARVLISALRRGKARVIISALRRGKARVIMRMPPAALPTAPPAVVALARRADEARRPRPLAPAPRSRAPHRLTLLAKGP